MFLHITIYIFLLHRVVGKKSHFHHKWLSYRSFLALSIPLWITDKCHRYTDQDFKLLEEAIIDDVINSKHLSLFYIYCNIALDYRILAKVSDPDRVKFLRKI